MRGVWLLALLLALGCEDKSPCPEVCAAADECLGIDDANNCTADCEEEREATPDDERDSFDECLECRTGIFERCDFTSGDSCEAACSPTSDTCCDADDPCDLADNGICDCDESWDDSDCDSANCCEAGNPCGWSLNGICDCGGTQGWDIQDCS